MFNDNVDFTDVLFRLLTDIYKYFCVFISGMQVKGDIGIVWFRFKEGFNNAVRHRVKMQDLL